MGFAADLEVLCIKAGEKCEKVVQLAALDIYSQCIARSPVGNPDVWKVNKEQVYMRETHNLWVEAINSSLGKGEKRMRRMGQKALKTTYANKGGKGYVGGRFKNNWQIGIGSMNSDTSRAPDGGGSSALAAFGPAMSAWKPGQTIWLTNSLPYAKPLEYGHSKQAPGGIVRLSVQNTDQIFSKAAAQVRNT